MKILYVYKDYMRRRKKYGEMMSQCGHNVKYFEIWKKREKNKLRSKHIKKINPDAVWFFNPIYIRNNLEAVEFIRSKKIPIILYNTYIPSEPYADSMDIWKKVDFLFVHNLEFNKFLVSKGLNSYYMPIGFYPSQYFEGKPRVSNKYDVTFCGTALVRDTSFEDKRSQYLRSLKNENIVVFGKSFCGKVDGISVKGYKEHHEQRDIYWRSKINLDLPFFHSYPDFYKNKYHIKNRFFEIPATRSFFLTVRCPEFLRIFDEETIGYYDDNIESLKETVKKYLKDKNKRDKMVDRAYKVVYQKHTYLHRFKEMFKIIKN